MKRLELILFRFACLAAAGGFLFCGFIALVTESSSERAAATMFAVIGPVAVMVVFYAVRWALTGRLKPWVPVSEVGNQT
ncbi:hypothetical protein [Massilia aerilata]|uniref:Uncharacterized protein n=1 Tax=Massilia aerilata TaxID=453817 RepID=A0ABW0S3K6_9BURK